MIRPVSAPAPSTAPSAPLLPERAALREAAEGFEAIMLRKLLASARASSFAEETPLTGGGMQQFQTMRDEHFANLAAQSGAFGFARSIEASLAQHMPATPAPQGE
ncbi:flagellar biosynthesis protein FlgJ [Porphyrobacter sp. TH134]|uniref:flagellar biosynthesis protein FlgJ n=1 Tax=Porphyrobacter sp. TH134 TaxID=2067450 RepID=UPI000C7E201D|nr:flagellar biosynthesis protein FlgJ [Porphyrobacter sp. TH134]PLK24168.1 flagellar biosynthesis protein FlgJ [Porphyrobacter sp. TH134]